MCPQPAVRTTPLKLGAREAGRILLSVLWVAIRLANGQAAAEAPPAPEPGRIQLSQLGLERWGLESGLAGSGVLDIVEGHDGFLWIATSGGLSRFDGGSFVNFTAANTAELPTSWITALARGGEGRIWIGLSHGGVRVLRGGRIERPAWTEAFPASLTVKRLVEDDAGTLWIGTTNGLWRASTGSMEQVSPGAGQKQADVDALLTSGDTLWARTAHHGVWRIRAGTVETLPEIERCDGRGLALGSAGQIFTSCVDGIWRWKPGMERWIQLSEARNTGPLLVDSRGGLWFGSRAGLIRWREGETQVLPPDSGLGDWRIQAWLEDGSGNLWLGTYSGGLARLRRGPVVSFGADEGLPVDEVTAVLARADGSLWVGSYLKGVVHWDPASGVLRHWTSRDGLPDDRVWALADDPRRPDRIWVGTGDGLVSIEGDAVRALPLPGIPQDLRVVFTDPAEAGALWLSGNSGGAVELQGDDLTVHDERRGLALERVAFFHRDRRGRLLAGGLEGLFQLADDRWIEETLDDGPVRGLRTIDEQEDGTLWLASDFDGLIRSAADGTTRFGPRDGLPLSKIFSIGADGAGGIWLSGDEGLFRFMALDHERWRSGELEAIPFERLSRRDGLRDTECNGWGSPASTRLTDGRLVYPTISGVAVVDSATLPTVELRPEEILADAGWSGSRELDLSRTVELGARERSLRLRFTAIEMLRPEAVSFRYQLEGYDEGWVPAGPVHEAAYAHLRPGRFRFRLQARLPGRPWVESSRPLRISVEPLLWEATWFRALVVALLVAVGVVAYRWRMAIEGRHAAVLERRRAEARKLSLQLLRAQEDERRRLGQELHDDLTQRLAGLAMLAGNAAREVAAGGEDAIRWKLEEIGSSLERMADETQNLSRDLHPPVLERLGLEEGLRTESARFERRTGLAVDFASRGRISEPPREVALALYRIAQEGLRNCASHSKASAVSLSLRADGSALVLEIEDSGVGFDPASVLASPGMGLASMSERARLIGGELRIDAAPGRGARLTVRVPLGTPAVENPAG